VEGPHEGTPSPAAACSEGTGEQNGSLVMRLLKLFFTQNNCFIPHRIKKPASTKQNKSVPYKVILKLISSENFQKDY